MNPIPGSAAGGKGMRPGVQRTSQADRCATTRSMTILVLPLLVLLVLQVLLVHAGATAAAAGSAGGSGGRAAAACSC